MAREVAEQGYGYLEDRRPSSNCDPYRVSKSYEIYDYNSFADGKADLKITKEMPRWGYFKLLQFQIF